MNQKSGGLDEEWNKVVDVLSQIIPVYDRVNHFISFGKDRGYRKEGILKTVESNDIVLDAGAGPGVMSQILLQSVQNIENLVLLDPLNLMLFHARKRIGDKIGHLTLGIFENLPFRDKSFDVVMTGFAIRDARNLSSAVKEINRVLKDEGRLLIVDLGKPNNQLLRWIIGLHWRYIVGLIGFFAVGKRGLLFTTLYTTYQKLLTNKEQKSLLEEYFSDVSFQTRMLGGLIIVRCEKHE
ncbi:class I SAM-dependent methyltransferase [Thermoproteota archaeon]